MGKKKPFIDKKKATTFHVVYKEHDDSEDPFELVSVDDMRQRVEEAAEAASSRHPLAFLYEDEDDQVQSEEQRQEIISMGLPDDGYNYLKHMRAVGSRQQMLLVPSSVPEDEPVTEKEEGDPLASFVPPEEDVVFIDASALPASHTSEKQEAADGRQTTVSAFSRVIHHADKVSKLAAIAELTEIMDELDDDDAAFLQAEGHAPEAILAEGDLLDDFIETAQRADQDGEDEDGEGEGDNGQAALYRGHKSRGAGPSRAGAFAGEGYGESDEEDYEGWEGGVQWAPHVGEQGIVRRSPASIAESFWRKERVDRTDAQTVADERLIARMDLEYNDDEIGSLEDEEDATRDPRAWAADDARLQKVLEAYDRSHQNGRTVVASLAEQLSATADPCTTDVADPRLTAPGAACETSSGVEDDAAAARRTALEAAARFESADAAAASADSRQDGADVAFFLEPRKVQEDCESVLSKCSNLYNHPGRIEAPAARTKGFRGSRAGAPCAPGLVQLSNKTGLPLGVGIGGASRRGADAIDGIREGSEEEEEGSDGEELEGVNLGVAREKGETAGDKKARKAAVKEARRVARQSKKELKQVFSSARSSMQKHVASNTRAQRSVLHMT